MTQPAPQHSPLHHAPPPAMSPAATPAWRAAAAAPPAGGGGGGGGGEQAGDFAEKLVAELTAPGGVRAAVPREQMRKFVAACAARDVCEAVCVLLASCLSAEVRP